MKLKSLSLHHYRNLDSVSLKFENSITVFVGENGQGKTNIIEAICYLASGRSFRINSDIPLIKQSEVFARIHAYVENSKRHYELEVVLSESGKYLQVNKAPVKRLSDFMGYCNVVLFNPDDINFYTTSPKKRRHDIDYELGKISRKYIDYLSRSQHLLMERNALLKQRNLDESYLELITEELVTSSVPIMEMRQKFITSLNPLINHYYQILMDTDDTVTLDYKASVSLDLTYEESYRSKLRDSWQRDKDFKVTHFGIHRDDFVFMINDNPVINVSSQGQKRMLVIAFKLAIVELMANNGQDYPILCLDDLFSELDPKRRELVLTIIPDSVQVFITTTDLEFIKTERKISVYRINEGCSEEVLK